NERLYKKRQALVEHPYGTLKRQWGFDHIMTKKGIKAASADLGLMMLAYNLKRILKLIKQKKLCFTNVKTAIYHLEMQLALILNCFYAPKNHFQKILTPR
ncbi:IS1182 family transposase, partial [Mesonia sediminis]